jgi:hypothetical protein
VRIGHDGVLAGVGISLRRRWDGRRDGMIRWLEEGGDDRVVHVERRASPNET